MAKISTAKFVSLVVKHKHCVQAFVASFALGRGHIDDVVQNTFVTAWKKLDTFEYTRETPDVEFSRWVFAIAKFESLAYRRKNFTVATLSEEVIERLADMQMASDTVLANRLQALTVCVEKLSDDDKLLVRERFEEGRSALEIAETRGVTRQSVSKWLVRIRESLGQCVNKSLAESEAFGV